MSLTKVFVYGTLKDGKSNDRPIYKDNRLSVEQATIKGTLLDMGRFPGLILEGKTVVQGEVHTYPEGRMEEILVNMDRLEGYQPGNSEDVNFYNRRTVDVTLLNGEKVRAYLYEINKAYKKRAPIIESGVWSPKSR